MDGNGQNANDHDVRDFTGTMLILPFVSDAAS